MDAAGTFGSRSVLMMSLKYGSWCFRGSMAGNCAALGKVDRTRPVYCDLVVQRLEEFAGQSA